MRLIFLSDSVTFLLCFLVWPVLQISAALICFILPDRFFSPNSFFFKSHRFEQNGKLYDKVFRVSRWKHLLPDGGAVLKKNGYKKKRLNNFSKNNLNRFLIESARGEMTHWLAIFSFWIFWFFTPPLVPWLMLVYALLANIPCIVVQRYNRPRIQHLLDRMKPKEL